MERGEQGMKDSDFLLCVIAAKGRRVKGRTLLQKTCYFVSVLLARVRETDFKAHFYGTHSITHVDPIPDLSAKR